MEHKAKKCAVVMLLFEAQSFGMQLVHRVFMAGKKMDGLFGRNAKKKQ